jgi:hypothetical protein
MNELLVFLALCVLGSSYTVNHRQKIFGIKPIFLPFLLLGLMAVIEFVDKKGVPSVSIVFFFTICFIVWLVRKGSL